MKSTAVLLFLPPFSGLDKTPLVVRCEGGAAATYWILSETQHRPNNRRPWSRVLEGEPCRQAPTWWWPSCSDFEWLCNRCHCAFTFLFFHGRTRSKRFDVTAPPRLLLRRKATNNLLVETSKHESRTDPTVIYQVWFEGTVGFFAVYRLKPHCTEYSEIRLFTHHTQIK